MTKLTIWVTPGGDHKIETEGLPTAVTLSSLLKGVAEKEAFKEKALADAAMEVEVASTEEE